MPTPSMLLVRLLLAVTIPRRDRRSERGDVPGWVLITVMTAGLVMILWSLARTQLTEMLRDALASVHN